jgi:DNA-binding IclR family transcriptional regulator
LSTIERAVELLNLFDLETPELGLSEVTRRMARDKATCHRHLCALQAVGLLEQNPSTKKYTMGPAVLRWAALREAIVPRKSSVEASLQTIATATGELAHATLLEGAQLNALANCEAGMHSTRVVLDEPYLPLNATASGLAVLAFGQTDQLLGSLDGLAAFTDNTIASPSELEQALQTVRDTGFGVSNQGFEVGVHGISVPLFDGTGFAAGAISVASVAMRMTPALEAKIQRHLIEEARIVTRLWGGVVPAKLDEIWQTHLDSIVPNQTS